MTTKSLKILHIYKDYYPVLGGIENHIRVLAEAQAAAGHDVTVLVANPGLRTEINMEGGVRVVRAGRLSTLASVPISPALCFWASRLKTDVAHLHFPHPLGEVANLLGRPASSTVITYHSDVVRQQWWLKLYRPLLLRVLGKADRLIATSEAYVDSSLYLRPWREKCTVIPLGVEVDRFVPPQEGDLRRLRERFGLAFDRPVLAFVGRLRYYKGLDGLLRAVKDIPEVQVFVVGEGPMKATWEALSGELGLGKRVTFAGEVPEKDLPACYQAADLFVLPANARSEAFGTVILEALASGLPVISTALGTGTSWVNHHGTTGLVVPPRDPESLSQAIKALLVDPVQRRKMGLSARERAVALFSQTQMIERVEEVYREVLFAAMRH